MSSSLIDRLTPAAGPGRAPGRRASIAGGPIALTVACLLWATAAVSAQPQPQPQSQPQPQPQPQSQPQDSSAIPEASPAPATGAPASIVPAAAVPGPFVARPADRIMLQGNDRDGAAPVDGAPGAEPGSENEIADSPFSDSASAPASRSGAETGDLIAVAELETADPDSIGMLGDDDGGFGNDMWAGSRRSTIAVLLGRVPAEILSPVLRRLRQRLLLSAAEAPTGPPVSPGLLALRLERLAASGDLAGLVDMLERVGPGIGGEAISKLRADAYLLVGDLAGACGEARGAVRKSSLAHWLKLSAFCRLLDGDVTGASLAVELLLDDGEDDPLFFNVMARLLAGPGGEGSEQPFDIDALITLTPLDLGLLRASRQAVPLGAIVDAPALILRAITTSPATPVNTRLQAADAALRLGAMDDDVLAELFGALEFTDGERQKALVIAQADLGAKADALLYQLALDVPDPPYQARMLAAAWRLARRADRYPVMAKVNLEAARSIAPAPELVASAAEICRALLLAGDTGRVFEWYRVVRIRASEGNLEATKALLDLWPLLQIADPARTLPWSEQILDLWWQGQTVLPAAERIKRGRLLYTLLESLGQPVPESFWSKLYGGPLQEAATVPNMAIWRGMVAAASAHRLGETVVMVLLALADHGVVEASPTVLGSAIASLRTVGLADDARALALEAAVVRGL